MIHENNKESVISAGLLHTSQWEKTKTIYFWWGTPSVLSLDEVEDILDCFPMRWDDCEISFECNPEDITTEYVVWLFWLGINRISLWVQSLNSETLKAIHRSDEDTILRALGSIQDAISLTGKIRISVNIDFILGLPHAGKWETFEAMQRLHQNYPCIAHTSIYILEKWLYPKSWKNHTIDDEDIREEFIDIIAYMNTLGWHHYEFSNFARPGYESLHNQSYWDHSEYRGFGLSSASYVGWVRFMNSDSFSGYYAWRRIDTEILWESEIALEELMFWLRTTWYQNRGYIRQKNIDEAIQKGNITATDGYIHLTKTWIFVIDHIISELIS